MRVVTWNINSIRLRLNNFIRLKDEINPDVICLQETKVTNELFPYSFFADLGYNFIEFTGEKSYNGVAIISRLPLNKTFHLKIVNETDCRHIATYINDIELHNFYIPAGGDIPDASLNHKFDHKLQFIDYMSNWFKNNRSSQNKIIIVGDLNVAPLEKDVWSHKQLLSVVSHTPIEVEKLNNLKASINFIDTTRYFVPENEKIYSWWSYRNKDWRKSDRGRRLDHIWASHILENNLKASFILKDARDWPLPSDHVPVITDFVAL